jgi:hypothetical protein
MHYDRRFLLDSKRESAFVRIIDKNILALSFYWTYWFFFFGESGFVAAWNGISPICSIIFCIVLHAGGSRYL